VKLTHREWINPLECLKERGIDASEWLTFDPHVVPQYRIIRQQSHDGLVAFTEQMIGEVLDGLATRTSFYKPDGPPARPPKYIVGWLRLAVAYGKVDLPCGRYPGQRERITLPVRVVPQEEGSWPVYLEVRGEVFSIKPAGIAP